VSVEELLTKAYAADPIACWVAGVAIGMVALALLFRRGGIDAGYIIKVFATLATIGTVLKIIRWGGTNLSGTDYVLGAGGLLAIIFVGIQELIDAFVGDRKNESLALRGWRLAPKLLSRWFPGQQEQLEETPEAAAERERLEAD